MMKEYKRWLEFATDETIARELAEMGDSQERIEDAFYRALEFGTGGLRGTLGAGTNRMNKYIIRKATRGFANYNVDLPASLP